MTLNLEQIKEIIPHRDPFLLIDEVTELEPGVSVTAKKYLKPDEYWFKGHFPGQPVQPGVLMIEMLLRRARYALCRSLKTRARSRSSQVSTRRDSVGR